MHNDNKTRIAILGVTGRMGRALLAAAAERDDVTVVGATASANSAHLNRPVASIGPCFDADLSITSDVAAALKRADVAIDFTLPDATEQNLLACVDAGCALVLGTTGHADELKLRIRQMAARIAILQAANMSLGVNLLLQLVELAAARLDDSYDLEIFEAHHRNKKDAPSGTALALGEAAAKGRGAVLRDVAEYSRQGSGEARKRGAIGFSVFRGGDVVGDHTVTFAGAGERIELTHRASDRMAFARGAMQAARWLARKPSGLYAMKDVLGF